jgi:hypothetical protein
LLDDDINGKPTSQADGINKVFLPGDLDKVRQNVEDRQQGIELHPTKPVSWAEAGWPAEEQEPSSQEPAQEEEPPSQEPAEEEEPSSQEPVEEEEPSSQEPAEEEERTPSVSSEEPEAEAPQEEPQEEGATSQVVHKYEYM